MDALALPREPQKLHLAQLDVLRGVAILAVYAYHFVGGMMGYQHFPWRGLWRDFGEYKLVSALWIYPATCGWVGVPLFFVISGFVIHLSYLKTSDFNLRRYYWRRFWRIYPPYLLATIAFIILTQVPVRSRLGALQVISHLLLIHNFNGQTFFGINPSFWSLAVEAQFYLAYPLLLVMRQAWGIKGALRFTAALSFLALCSTIAWTHSGHALPNAVALNPLFLWVVWALGAYVAECYHAGHRAFALPPGCIIGLATLFVLSTCFKPLFGTSYYLASLLAALAVEAYAYQQRSLSRIEKPLALLGVCSYSFYLWHQPLITRSSNLLHRVAATIPHAELIIYGITDFLLLFSLSWLLYLSIERWSLALSHRHRN